MNQPTSKNLDIDKLRKLAHEIRDFTQKERMEWPIHYDQNEVDRRRDSENIKE